MIFLGVSFHLFLILEQAKLALLEGKGAEKIVKKLEFLEKAFDEQSDNRVEFVACGSMLNIVSDNGKYSLTSIHCKVKGSC